MQSELHNGHTGLAHSDAYEASARTQVVVSARSIWLAEANGSLAFFRVAYYRRNAPANASAPVRFGGSLENFPDCSTDFINLFGRHRWKEREREAGLRCRLCLRQRASRSERQISKIRLAVNRRKICLRRDSALLQTCDQLPTQARRCSPEEPDNVNEPTALSSRDHVWKTNVRNTRQAAVVFGGNSFARG